ncbi:hypothetical protein ACFWGI_01320 [Streptomyces niveus]|uniref:hypothetical protein n=1 Tax=Streptomyces niveus TaxID=193462 RepID=UPI003654B357
MLTVVSVTTRRAAIAVTAMAVLGGCSSSGAGGGEPGLGSVPSPSSFDVAQISTPLDAYLPTPEENYTLKKARVMLVNQCMRQLGYPDNPQPLGKFTGKAYLEHGEFLVAPVEQVERWGYKSPPGAETGKQADESSFTKNATKTQGQLLAGRITTFNGKPVPDGGCEGEALRTLTKGAETAQEVTFPDGSAAGAGKDGFGEGFAEMVVSSARGKAMAKVRNDSRFEKVTTAWSDCMDKQGYDFDSPSAANNDKRWADATQPGKEEIAVAVADMRCKQKVNYLGVGIAVESAYEKQLIEEDAEILKDAKDKTAKWIENANKALKEN